MFRNVQTLQWGLSEEETGLFSCEPSEPKAEGRRPKASRGEPGQLGQLGVRPDGMRCRSAHLPELAVCPVCFRSSEVKRHHAQQPYLLSVHTPRLSCCSLSLSLFTAQAWHDTSKMLELKCGCVRTGDTPICLHPTYSFDVCSILK